MCGENLFSMMNSSTSETHGKGVKRMDAMTIPRLSISVSLATPINPMGRCAYAQVAGQAWCHPEQWSVLLVDGYASTTM